MTSTADTKDQQTSSLETDIVIIGSGLAGLCFAATLAEHSEKRVTLIERRALSQLPESDIDSRTVALSSTTVSLFKEIRIWPLLAEKTNPVWTIHVSSEGRFGSSIMEPPAQNQQQPLGYVTTYAALSNALLAKLSESQHCQLLDSAIVGSANSITQTTSGWQLQVTTEQGDCTIDTRLLIGSDGAQSALRDFWRFSVDEHDYQLDGLVCSLHCEADNQNTAYERFMDQGLAALLPQNDHHFGLAWALPRDSELFHASPEQLAKEVQRHVGWRAGRLSVVSSVARFPLKRTLANDWHLRNGFLLGNSQHSLHPVAGQGFNLSARDAHSLAKLCIEHDLDYQHILPAYQKVREQDHQRTVTLSHQLPKLFNYRNPLVGLSRQLGLLAFDSMPAIAKSWFVQQAMGQHAKRL
ncbi:MAG: FAD-dependent monooxygenase [Pseudomonadota bacterium]|nr:FAD-dependent monooxygenase [Pseudomonadota bacterium]